MKQLLTIELVPQTCWYSNVRSNVSQDDWEKLKKITFKRAGYRCEICGGRGTKWWVECHERWEYDDVRHIQKLVGLLALCPACHEVKHMGLATTRGHAAQATDHLARVNDWTLADAEAYVEVCFEVWSQRSKHEWQLDISCLQDYGIAVPAIKR